MKSSYVTLIIATLMVFAPLFLSARVKRGYNAERIRKRLYRSVRTANKASLKSLIPPAQVPSTFDDFAGQVVEVSGRIVGTAPMDNGKLLILDCNGASVTLNAPSSAPSYWLDAGAIIRCLLKVPAQSELTANHNSLDLIASAPEGAVAAADQADADAETARQNAVAAKATAEADRMRLAQLAAMQYYSRTSTSQPSRSARYDLRTNLVRGHPLTNLTANQLAVYPTYRAAVSKLNPRLGDTDLDKITTSVLYYSGKEDIDPRLIIAMIIAESGFDPLSTSRTGAMGLGQLMPGTAAGLGVTNAYDPIQNIGAAVHILSANVRKYGGASQSGIVPEPTLLLCMAAYNAGSGAVKKYGGIPPYRETQVYVRRVASIYRTLCSND